MLKDRLLISIPLLVVVSLAFILPGRPGDIAFALLCTAFLIGACREFFALADRFADGGDPTLTYLCGIALVIAAMVTDHSSPNALVVRFLLDVVIVTGFLFVCFLNVCRQGVDGRAIRRAVTSIAAFMYVCWLGSFLPKLYFSGSDTAGRLLVLYLLAVTKTADAGAYAVGTLTARRPGGNHKLIPAISPRKSWEGLVGGTAASLLTALLLQSWLGDRLTVFGNPALGPGDACVIGIAASLFGLVGDLVESMLKRAAGAKDSGRLPGLGGLLDLLDSLIATGPLFFAYIYLAAFLG